MGGGAVSSPAPARETPDLATLVQSRVRLRAQRRAAWLRSLWAERDASPGPTGRPDVDASLEGWDDPEAERRWQSEAPARALSEEIAAVDKSVADRGSRLARLVAIFSLEPAESEYLQVCLAASLDPSLGRAFAFLGDQGSRAYPTEPLVARLFGHDLHRSLIPESPLRRWELIHSSLVGPGEPDALSCDPLVRDWLLGESGLDEALVGVARLHPTLDPLECWLVEETAAGLRTILETSRARVQIIGPPGSGRRTLAACIAGRLGLPLLVVDADAVPDEDWPRTFPARPAASLSRRLRARLDRRRGPGAALAGGDEPLPRTVRRLGGRRRAPAAKRLWWTRRSRCRHPR